MPKTRRVKKRRTLRGGVQPFTQPSLEEQIKDHLSRPIVESTYTENAEKLSKFIIYSLGPEPLSLKSTSQHVKELSEFIIYLVRAMPSDEAIKKNDLLEPILKSMIVLLKELNNPGLVGDNTHFYTALLNAIEHGGYIDNENQS